MSSSPVVPRILPRVLVVSSRSTGQDNMFIGECHLDGAVSILVPPVSGVHAMLHSLEPIHGVLLCGGGEDMNLSLYGGGQDLSAGQLEAMKRLPASDATVQQEKHCMELLARCCLKRDMPFLGICYGSQILNVACGGSLHKDVKRELMPRSATDYHQVRVLPGTPLHDWFADNQVMMVKSYDHQAGVKRLAQRFVPMALAPDGLVEGFYDPDAYSPGEGRFIVGLQFQPERSMRMVYQEFLRAVFAYQEKQLSVPLLLGEKLAHVSRATRWTVAAIVQIVCPVGVTSCLVYAYTPSFFTSVPWRLPLLLSSGSYWSLVFLVRSYADLFLPATPVTVVDKLFGVGMWGIGLGVIGLMLSIVLGISVKDSRVLAGCTCLVAVFLLGLAAFWVWLARTYGRDDASESSTPTATAVAPACVPPRLPI